jgi:hypothetical protein
MGFLVPILIITAGSFVVAKFFPRLMLVLSLILISGFLFYPFLDPYVEPLIHPVKPGVMDDSVRIFPVACLGFGIPILLGVILRKFCLKR